MKLSKIVIGSIMLLGVYAHADMASEFKAANEVASRKAEASYYRQLETQERQKSLQKERQQTAEIRQLLANGGIDVSNVKIEFGSTNLVLCRAGSSTDCGPAIDTYFAKSGNIICEIKYQSASFDSKKNISKVCYDSTNPQPTGAYQQLEIISN